MYDYTMGFELNVEGNVWEGEKEFQSPCMFRAGDLLHMGEYLEDCRVAEVSWFMSDHGRAYIGMEPIALDGTAESWLDPLADTFDSVCGSYWRDGREIMV
jgi:hypothetical protein